ncbi:MAG: hypothetical protein HQL54_12970 [Magnetococcales bacterium]|nr:hypothetical protein [Magnetococcales bacterium]
MNGSNAVATDLIPQNHGAVSTPCHQLENVVKVDFRTCASGGIGSELDKRVASIPVLLKNCTTLDQIEEALTSFRFTDEYNEPEIKQLVNEFSPSPLNLFILVCAIHICRIGIPMYGGTFANIAAIHGFRYGNGAAFSSSKRGIFSCLTDATDYWEERIDAELSENIALAFENKRGVFAWG